MFQPGGPRAKRCERAVFSFQLQPVLANRRWRRLVKSAPQQGLATASGLWLLALLVAALAGCASPPALQASNHPGAGVLPPPSQSIDKVLRGDPRFTDFIDVVDFAGLSHELADGRDMTVFAPTNAAFSHSDPNWRAWAMPQTAKDSPNSHAARQELVEAAAIRGIHPPSDFMGKVQDVQSIGGTVFHVDGRTPGVITISSGPVAADRIGLAASPRVMAQLQTPPLQAADGLIYPANGIVVPIPGAQ